MFWPPFPSEPPPYETPEALKRAFEEQDRREQHVISLLEAIAFHLDRIAVVLERKFNG